MESLYLVLREKGRDYPCSWLMLTTDRLFQPVRSRGSHYLELEFVTATATGTIYRVGATVLVAPLPLHPHWQPVELQLHSADHDDGRWQPAELVRELAGRGCRAIYFTPHADLIAGYWDDFVHSCRELSGTLAVFPGLEVATRGDAGHLLLYGLQNPDGFPNASSPGQAIIDRTNLLPGFTASVTVAHPFGRPPWPWREEPVDNYSGLEVFSGIQLHFDLQSRPLQLWLAELERLSGRIKRAGLLPSARAGSDWHQVIPYPAYVTYVYLPAGWQDLPWPQRRWHLDLALRRGNTVASRRGGLVYFHLNGQPPGARFALSAGAQMEFQIYWQAVIEGGYKISLFQGHPLNRNQYPSLVGNINDIPASCQSGYWHSQSRQATGFPGRPIPGDITTDCNLFFRGSPFVPDASSFYQPVWETEVTARSGEAYQWTWQRVAAGREAVAGRGSVSFYWLYVSGADQVVTTPIWLEIV
jgi:hypothetical protein